MAHPLLVATLQSAWLGSMVPAWRRFQGAVASPHNAQLRRLGTILPSLAPSAYGREHSLHDVQSIAGLRARAPVVTYPDLEPWIQRILAGDPGVLTSDPVLMLERTGGSSGADKLIPYTTALRSEFGAATSAWLFELHRRRPSLLGTRSYWSMSPATRGREVTPGGLPVGFEDDTEYFGPLAAAALRRLLAVPPEVTRIPNMAAWRQSSLHYLISCRDLGLISVWSPTFLTRLMESLESNLDAFLARLPLPRQGEIRRALDRLGSLQGGALWPRLVVISCWTDGSSALFLPALRRYFPSTAIQPKGLLATEGVVSFPFGEGPDAAVALTSHFLEFEDLDANGRPPRLAHELRAGGRYAPLLTTGGGLLRYRLGDVVLCTGHISHCPLVRFEGRLDRVSDLCGEKIHARQVDMALALAMAALGVRLRFALLAPVTPSPTGDAARPELTPGLKSPPTLDQATHLPAYRLFVEGDAEAEMLEALRTHLEASLAQGHHYRYARALGQLGPLQIQRVTEGWRHFERALVSRGARPGDVKPTSLDTRPIWNEVFPEEESSSGSVAD